MPYSSRRPSDAWRVLLLQVAIPGILAWCLVDVLHRRIHPDPARVALADHQAYGTVSLRLKLPGTAGGVAEPLVVCGAPGQATLVYIRLLSHARARVGIEFWGRGAVDSEPFKLPAADAEITLACSFPALFPREGDRRWGRTPPEVQKQRQRDFQIRVDGVVRLNGEFPYFQPPHPPLFIAENPLGGSVVTPLFTGKVLAVSQSL